MSAVPSSYVTATQYLQFERGSSVKHEYIQGQIVAMAGGTVRHGLISRNISRALSARLRGSDCTPLGSDVKLRIVATDEFFYPDVTVICGDLRAHQSSDFVEEAVAVFEVLSPSTERVDRGPKFLSYQKIPSLAAYVLVSQDKPLVEVFERQPNDTWVYAAYMRIEGDLHLPFSEVSLPLFEIYEEVLFEAAGSSSGS